MLRRQRWAKGQTIVQQEGDIVDLDLPRPDAAAVAHSRKLIEHLRARIDAGGGWISFADYMQEVLYAPGLGYYSAGATRFGEQGDFITAPELTPLFSRCVATQCAQALLASGGDTLVEPGAGSGIMAAHILNALADIDALPRRYLVVEPSADLRAQQKQTIEELASAHAGMVAWVDEPPPHFDGVLVANEVLDAIPCERFESRHDGLQQLGVGWEQGRLVERQRPAPKQLGATITEAVAAAGRSLPPGYRSEWRPALRPFIEDWSRRLGTGLMLWIDYGCSRRDYYAPVRSQGTLLCHYRHRAHGDPLVYPGLQDITAWVDFTAVAEAAADTGCRVQGFTTQAHFLLGAGIEQQFTQLRSSLDKADALQLGKAVQRLLMPGEMGEKFRVIALSKDLPTELVGFRLRDMAASL